MTHRARGGAPPGPDSWWGSLIHNKRDLTGQLYMRNRYYDARSGRFTQEDPIGLAGGINVYGFAAGDPVSYSDPYGLSPDTVIFTGEEAETLWGELKSRAKAAKGSNSSALRFLGGLLTGMLDEMEQSNTTFAISAMDLPDYASEAERGGGSVRCHATRLCFINVDTNKTGYGAHIGSLTTLAHEAGGAYLWTTAGVDHFSPFGSVMVENIARAIFGCLARIGHDDGVTPCRH